ncbi:hypothetical protein BV25DRAFT_1917980 [Artomyces pyxidatus]|uniref:Uncharacterized protein n=1 Tax=Artomyces pyxidatus TaxID=48021 RepID=A0ACB8SV48_9AGAM|nr:hypothetical protein BV25DRAFT_1917980 [Artomyces pyxidatus]
MSSSCASSNQTETSLKQTHAAEFWPTVTRSRLLPFDGASPEDDRAAILSTRQALELERTSIESVMLSVATRLNELSDTARLPSEILAHIFLFYVSMVMRWDPEPRALWMKQIMHVCHRWREVALGHPRLWRTVILPLIAEGADEIFSRSRSMPLILHWKSGLEQTRREKRNVSLALANLTRVKAIYFGDYDGYKSDLQQLMKIPAPILVSANIPGVPLDMEYFRTLTLFGGLAPCLRNLTLRDWGIPIPRDPTILHNLVFLKIVRYDSRVPAIHSSEDILSVLKTIYALERLELRGCMTEESVQSLDLEENLIVALPHLKSLRLWDPLPQCVRLLQHLRLPAAGIRFLLMCKTSVTLSAVRKLSPLLSNVRGASGDPYTYLQMGRDNYSYWARKSLPFVLGANRDPKSGWDEPYELELALGWDDDSGWKLIDLMHALCEAISVEHIERLILDMDDNFQQSDWLRMFGSSTKLQFIAARNDAGLKLCETLQLQSTDGQHWTAFDAGEVSGDGGRFFLPRLESMELIGVDFTTFYPREQLQLHDLLPRWLQARKVGGAPMKRMMIMVCSCRLRWLPEFEVIGVKVDYEFSDESFSDEDPEEEYEKYTNWIESWRNTGVGEISFF